MSVRIRTMMVLVAVLVVVALLGGAGLGRWIGEFSLPGASSGCVVVIPETMPGAGDSELRRVVLDTEQMANAATIAAIGVQRGLPPRAVVVALATGFQESKLRNLAGGDRDSVGLFQQRPSQGWGSVAEIRDTRYATNAFYAGLERVRGWEDMRVTDAAQAVQRSAFPEAYEKWADESEVLTAALLGDATGAVSCTVDRDPAMRGVEATAALADGLRLDWGDLETLFPAWESPALTVPVTDVRAGWRYAHWLVSHATDHGVKRVAYADQEWTAEDGVWVPISGGGAEAGQVTAEVFA
ncbi:hypothetical protein O7632_12100 [Solwaraspora sp. WMMD406]|uniref:hypothetical protein n=1 Tax=Solwaraspora sp. WMMD406 TaxID=3016095 RepID=UPI0024166ABE|nr:hypothetical protein [Solwaraspora sp. WMMD406]MDG4764835.1 hypothetical protein [Solwaraspora sp. WMMD406]